MENIDFGSRTVGITTVTGASFRAFIAIEIGKNEKISKMLDALRNTGAQLKLVDPAYMHITLKFLGDTEEYLIPEITRIISAALENVQPFDIKIYGMGAFPNPNRINVVWIGLQEVGLLIKIAEFIDINLVSYGFPRENRPFSPHLTLARVKSGRNLGEVQRIIKENAQIDCGSQRIYSVKLKKSVLTPNAPIYSTVAEIEIK
jgi:2'-5' RNA ligase